jgi:hypothetical protein
MLDLKYQCRRCKQKCVSVLPRDFFYQCHVWLGEAVHYFADCRGSEAAAFYQGIDIGYGLLNSTLSTCCAEVAKRQHGVAVYAVGNTGYLLPGEISFHCCFGKLRVHAIST